MPGCARSANTNHGTAIATNNASPLTQGKDHTLRHWRVQLIQTNNTKPGNNKPIKPLLSTPKAQATKPARAQPACVCPCASWCMNARAKQTMATLIHVATSMSWLMYWPPIKNAALAPSIQAARCATTRPAHARAHTHMRAPIVTACKATTQRAAQTVGPHTANEAASSQ